MTTTANSGDDQLDKATAAFCRALAPPRGHEERRLAAARAAVGEAGRYVHSWTREWGVHPWLVNAALACTKQLVAHAVHAVQQANPDAADSLVLWARHTGPLHVVVEVWYPLTTPPDLANDLLASVVRIASAVNHYPCSPKGRPGRTICAELTLPAAQGTPGQEPR